MGAALGRPPQPYTYSQPHHNPVVIRQASGSPDLRISTHGRRGTLHCEIPHPTSSRTVSLHRSSSAMQLSPLDSGLLTPQSQLSPRLLPYTPSHYLRPPNPPKVRSRNTSSDAHLSSFTTTRESSVDDLRLPENRQFQRLLAKTHKNLESRSRHIRALCQALGEFSGPTGPDADLSSRVSCLRESTGKMAKHLSLRESRGQTSALPVKVDLFSRELVEVVIEIDSWTRAGKKIVFPLLRSEDSTDAGHIGSDHKQMKKLREEAKRVGDKVFRLSGKLKCMYSMDHSPPTHLLITTIPEESTPGNSETRIATSQSTTAKAASPKSLPSRNEAKVPSPKKSPSKSRVEEPHNEKSPTVTVTPTDQVASSENPTGPKGQP